MIYTVRYAHLSEIYVKPGAIIKPGDVICRIGNTGKSTAAHLHIDCVEGEQYENWTLEDMELGRVKSAHRQLNYFIDAELFGTPIHITSYYNDPVYMVKFGKVHLAYDVVPENRHKTKRNWDVIFNRSFDGRVAACLEHGGYGKTLLLQFAA